MKRSLLSLLLFLSLALPSSSAWLYDGVDDVASVGPSSSVILIDAPWTLAGNVRVLSNAGTSSSRFYTGFDAGSGQAFDIALNEISSADPPNEVWVDISDGADELFYETTTDFFAGNTNWVAFALRRTGTSSTATVPIYFNNTLQALNGSATLNSLDAIANIQTMYIGNRSNLNRALNGSMANMAYWAIDLTDGQLESLSDGFSPGCYLNSQQWHVPGIRDNQEIRNGIAVTVSGPTITEHPRTFFCGE